MLLKCSFVRVGSVSERPWQEIVPARQHPEFVSLCI